MAAIFDLLCCYKQVNNNTKMHKRLLNPTGSSSFQPPPDTLYDFNNPKSQAHEAVPKQTHTNANEADLSMVEEGIPYFPLLNNPFMKGPKHSTTQRLHKTSPTPTPDPSPSL